MVTELHLQWDIAFLEQYLKERMVPRGREEADARMSFANKMTQI